MVNCPLPNGSTTSEWQHNLGARSWSDILLLLVAGSHTLHKNMVWRAEEGHIPRPPGAKEDGKEAPMVQCAPAGVGPASPTMPCVVARVGVSLRCCADVVLPALQSAVSPIWTSSMEALCSDYRRGTLLVIIGLQNIQHGIMQPVHTLRWYVQGRTAGETPKT